MNGIHDLLARRLRGSGLRLQESGCLGGLSVLPGRRRDWQSRTRRRFLNHNLR